MIPPVSRVLARAPWRGARTYRTLMGSTYHSLHYHIIFSTKHRQPFIGLPWRDTLHQYIGGTVRGLDGVARRIGGVEDHVHLLVDLTPNHKIAAFLRELKKASSLWASARHCRQFEWQDGYAAFTVSASRLEKVRAYVDSQQEHHRTISFIDELKILLKKHGINFDPKYLD